MKHWPLTKSNPRKKTQKKGKAAYTVNYLEGFWLGLLKDTYVWAVFGTKVALRWFKDWFKRPHIITIKIRWVLVGLLLLNAYGHHGGRIVYGDPISPAPQITKLNLKPLKPLPETPLKPVEAAVAVPVPEPVYIAPPAPTPTGSVNCGSDPMMAYIYQVESGCRSWAINPGGCIGLGQACPGGKLPCGLYDWACQDSWFRNYAVAAYGSIYNAYIFRESHNWW